MKAIKNIFILLIICAFATQYAGCSKDDSNPTNTEFLSKAWRIVSVTINGAADTSTDYSAFRLTFTVDGSYTLASPDGTDTGTWAFNSNETSIVVDAGTTDEFTMTIIALAASSLTIEFTESGNFKTADELNNWVMTPV